MNSKGTFRGKDKHLDNQGEDAEETRCRPMIALDESNAGGSQIFGTYSGLNTISSRVDTSRCEAPFEPLTFGRELVDHNKTQAYSPQTALHVPDILGETSGDGGEPKKSMPSRPLFQLPTGQSDEKNRPGGFQVSQSDPQILLNRESNLYSQQDGGKMSIEFLSPSTQQKKSTSLVSMSSASLVLSHTQ